MCRTRRPIKAREKRQSALNSRSINPVPPLDQLLSAISRHSAIFLLSVVCSVVPVIGVFVIRDLKAANAEAQEMYTGSVNGLQRIGQLQFDARETRLAIRFSSSDALQSAKLPSAACCLRKLVDCGQRRQ